MKAGVVAYVRRSTKDQAQSLERQRHEIERYAKERGIEIARWFQDDGISGTEDTLRPGFQEMVAAAERREFNVILVHEISRFGRFDAFQSGSWLHRLKAARVKVEAIEGAIRDPYSVQGKLLLALEQDRQESVKLSMRTLSGQRETASKGLRAGGKVPYGFARRVRRADATYATIPRVGRAKRDKSEVVELVLGDPAEVEAVRLMFGWARDGIGYRTIAGMLTDRGLPSPDAPRAKTIANMPGRWSATSVRAILMNPAYCGDAIWNVRSMPKFHRLEGDKIVALDEFESDHYRRNAKADWVVKRDAHPAIVDRATFDAVQSKLAAHAPRPRGHTEEYLLTGLLACATCGNVMFGMRRTRRKIVAGREKLYVDVTYCCAGALAQKGRCKLIMLPRDGLERVVLRTLDEEILSEEGIARLEVALRAEIARRSRVDHADEVGVLEKREADLAQRVADAGRRMLLVEESLLPEVRAALVELKDDLQRVRQTLEARRNSAKAVAGGDEAVRTIVDSVRSMRGVLRDKTFPLERRREILRRFLPTRDGVRPIRVEFDPTAKRGWRNALKRVTVRHLTTRAGPAQAQENRVSQAAVVAGAVSAEACLPLPGEDGVLDPGSWLPYGERRLGPDDFEDADELELVEVGAGTGGGDEDWA
jgi:site-specific DNA recombinase